MSAPILATKLYIPPPRTKAVSRTRLIEQMNQGLRGKLTLISAPAGFGKTTLVSEWVEEIDRPTAWLSLDEGDNDPTRFWTYFIAALQTIAPTLGEGVLGILQSSQPALTESMLTALLNEITTIPNSFLFVLDDYHVIEATVVSDTVAFLVENLTPQMHLVITTRDDPQLPLARLRARGQLTELRANDLRFTPSEAAEFLNHSMGLKLSAEDIAALENRTEGWIAGLQLAALSLQRHHDIHGFIQSFAGDHRYIMDYLVDEVLDHQPEPVRRFLLQTSILDRLSGSLCAAVMGEQKGSEQLAALEQGNFFIIPLDDKRQWYRYHHLFADVLRVHLMTEQPDQVPVLHRRASEWHEQNGSLTDAIRHALAAQDFERVADLIEQVMPAMRRSRQEITVLGWLQALPNECFQHRPVLSIHYAGVLLQTGKIEGVEARLWDAERWLEPGSALGQMVVIDEGEFRGLAGSVAMYRAACALIRGDVSSTMKHAQQVPDFVSEDDHLRRGAAAGLLGLAYWRMGDIEAAHRSYVDCMTRLQKIGYFSDAIGCAITLADIRITQGRLHDALHTYQQALQMATEQGTPSLRGTADMYVGLSEIERERNNLSAATQHLLRSKQLGELAGLPQNPYRWCLAMARIRAVEGDLEAAFDLLREGEQLYAGDFSPNVHPISTFKTRVWIRQGKLNAALGWAHEQGLSTNDDLSYLREFDHLTLARVLLAQYKSDPIDRLLHDVMTFLERLLKAAEEGGRTGSVIEILILQALAYQMQGDIPAALAPLEHALRLAQPEGYVRIFLDEGSSMEQLLRKAATRKIMPDYTGRLLGAFDKQGREIGENHSPAASVSRPLIEPLSQRELEILRLFKTDLSGPEIARELVIALSTLRTHTKSIFSKLNANNRRQAVKRAEELNLI